MLTQQDGSAARVQIERVNFFAAGGSAQISQTTAKGHEQLSASGCLVVSVNFSTHPIVKATSRSNMANVDLCRDAVHEFARTNGAGFWGGRGTLNRLHAKLPALVRCTPRSLDPIVLVDIGAAIQGLAYPWNLNATRMRAADSDSLLLLGYFASHSIQVHAFEMQRDKVDELRIAVTRRPWTQNIAQRLVVHNQGVGSRATRMHIRQCGASNTYALEDAPLVATGVNRCRRSVDDVEVTTLDLWANSANVSPFYVKLDVEGSEWDAVQGMLGLLTQGRIQLMSVEYAFGWNWRFLDKTQRERPTIHVKAHRQDEHVGVNDTNVTLFAFQGLMSSVGYDTYLLHGGSRAVPQVVLVPVHGPYWHPDLEICNDHTRFFPQPCYTDLLVVRRGNTCMRNALHRHVLPATASRGQNTRWQPFGRACPPRLVL